MRRPAGPVAPGISLFPFLAVLLCTMGALIVVLVVLNRHSRMQAEAVSAEGKKAQAEKLAAMRESAEQRRRDLDWQIGHLRESRDKTQADLDRERLRLSGIEEHRRQLEARLRELQQALAQFDHPESGTAGANQESGELAELKQQVEQARAELEKARLDAAGRARAYSVVPYDGPYRTRRRPIYIECTNDRVVIQPEGVELTPADFSGPMGPGNPLASAVRAARDHLAQVVADPRSSDAEPYPLFLVRPDGIEAYYAARAAMQSWGADFGYQTIDQDWKLEFPPSDPALAQVEQQAVSEARERLQWLAQMSPDRYGPGGGVRDSDEKVSYRVSPLGGLIREGGPTLHGRSAIRGASRDAGGRFASSSRSSSSGDLSVSGRRPPSGQSSSSRQVASSGLGREVGSTGPAQASLHSASHGTKGSGSSSMSEPGEHRGGKAGAQQPAEGTAAGSFAKPGEHRYGDLNDRGPSSGGSGSQGSGATEPASQAADAGAEMKFSPKPKEKLRSLAETRGANWGLSPAARASNPITRPIHMVCEGDKLMILAEKPGDPPVLVPLRYRTEESIDQLVMAVQERIRDWGLAGRGLYWRPQLILEVGHSGEGRFADLEALLADSGFDVKRR